MLHAVVLFVRQRNALDVEMGEENPQRGEDAGRENDSIGVVYLEQIRDGRPQIVRRDQHRLVAVHLNGPSSAPST